MDIEEINKLKDFEKLIEISKVYEYKYFSIYGDIKQVKFLFFKI